MAGKIQARSQKAHAFFSRILACLPRETTWRGADFRYLIPRFSHCRSLIQYFLCRLRLIPSISPSVPLPFRSRDLSVPCACCSSRHSSFCLRTSPPRSAPRWTHRRAIRAGFRRTAVPLHTGRMSNSWKGICPPPHEFFSERKNLFFPPCFCPPVRRNPPD